MYSLIERPKKGTPNLYTLLIHCDAVTGGRFSSRKLRTVCCYQRHGMSQFVRLE